MTVLLIGAAATLLLDQALKLLVLHGLARQSISLGPIGKLQSVQTQMWMARTPFHLKLPAIWSCWIVGAFILAAINAFVPASGWSCALLLGGSLSHTIETSWRGYICDYVCLRFWPAFNIADVAITIGFAGLAANLAFVIAAASG